jgi:FKBP-type peptidyl-prolyl cis-trans isomerase FklB
MHPLMKACGAAAAALACTAAFATPAQAPAAHPTSAQNPARVKSQASYSLGVSLGEMLRRASLDTRTLSTPRLVAGLRAALAGSATLTPADQQRIHELLLGARAHVVARNHAAARSFLERNGRRKGVVTTASGLQYQVLSPGKGRSPKPGDVVTVNYRGKLLDGTVFDSSYKRGQPATFPVDRVIPGWREALLRMKPGAKWRLFIPPKLGYDLNSPPPSPPGSLLVFDVHLLRVEPQAPQVAPPTPPPLTH